MRAPQAFAQEGSEEVVVAVVAPLLIQRNQEEVLPLQPLQHRPSIASTHERLAKWSVEGFDDGGFQHELTDVFRLAREHLFGQVVEDVARVPREVFRATCLVLAPFQGVRRKLEAGDPTLRPVLQRRDALAGEVQSHGASEEVGSLFQGEAQLGLAYLGEPSAARNLASGSGGLPRPATTRRIGGGAYSSKKARASWTAPERRTW